MELLFSPTTKSFYSPKLGGIPEDATIQVTFAERRVLRNQCERENRIIDADENGYPIAVEPPSAPKPTLNEARTTKRREITTAHDAFLKAQSEEYSEMERLTWDMQRTGADRLAADPEDKTEPALLVKAIAEAREIPVADMVTRIKENTLPWSIIAGRATGQRLKYQDALEACTTVEEVEAINPVFTLPE